MMVLYPHLFNKVGSTAEALRPIWNAIEECAEDLIAPTGKDLLPAISEIEDQLEQQNLYSRVTDRVKEDPN